MNQSNHPVSLTDFTATHETSHARFRKIADHCHEHDRSAPPPQTDPTQPETHKEPQAPPAESSELRSTSSSRDNQSSFFHLSPIEDALLRETFSGRFAL